MPAWLKALLDLLARLFAPKPTPPPGPTGPTGPTSPTGVTLPTGPSGPAPPFVVTPQTPFRNLAVVSAERVCAVLRGYPMEGECRIIHAALAGRPLALAQSWEESGYGRSENAERTRNALGLMQADGRTLQIFPTWAAGFSEWARRVDDPTYKNGVYMPRNMTLEQYVVTYVGGPGCWSTRGATCANGESWASTHRYLDETVARLNRYYGAGVTGPSGPAPTTPPAGLVFGRVPHPPYTRDLISKRQGAGMDLLGPRQNFGVVYHRTVGRSIRGTGDWFKNPAVNALTQYGVGTIPPGSAPGEDGLILMWADPEGPVSPWASGPWENPPGDGRAYVAKYGATAINRHLIAIEISGLYDDPLSDRAIEAVAALSAHWADRARIPHADYPLNPHTGLVYTYTHNEFQGHKLCPGPVVLNAVPEIIERTKAILREYQTGA